MGHSYRAVKPRADLSATATATGSKVFVAGESSGFDSACGANFRLRFQAPEQRWRRGEFGRRPGAARLGVLVEPFWALVREALANDTFDRLGQLQRVVGRRCRKLAADTATARGAVGFRWAVNSEA